MRLAHARCLLLYECQRAGRERLLEGILEGLLRHVLSALGLGDDGVVVLARDRGLDVHPAAMERSAHAARLLGIAAETAHFVLKLASHLGALARVLHEPAFDLRALQALGARFEAELAVLAGLDEIVEYGNRLVVLHRRESSFVTGVQAAK